MDLIDKLQESLKRKLRDRTQILTDEEATILTLVALKTIEESFGDTEWFDKEIMERVIRWGSLRATCEGEREKRGLSLKDASRLLKIPQYRLRAIEQGDLGTFDPSLARRYFVFLGIERWVAKWLDANSELAVITGLDTGAEDAREDAPKRKADTGADKPRPKPKRKRKTAGTLPDLTRQLVETKIEKYLRRRAPAHGSDPIKIGYRIRGNSVTIIESKPSFLEASAWDDIPVAQFRFDSKTKKWTLYCADRNSRWCLYYDTDPTRDFDALLQEVDEDPTGIFWG